MEIRGGQLHLDAKETKAWKRGNQAKIRAKAANYGGVAIVAADGEVVRPAIDWDKFFQTVTGGTF